jgi:hypothetical protein
VPKPNRALRARQAAAHEILSGDDRIDGPLLLSLVVWPTLDLEQAAEEAPFSKRVTLEQAARIFELADAGLSWAATAEQVLGSRRRKSTVGAVLHKVSSLSAGSTPTRRGCSRRSREWRTTGARLLICRAFAARTG